MWAWGARLSQALGTKIPQKTFLGILDLGYGRVNYNTGPVTLARASGTKFPQKTFLGMLDLRSWIRAC